MSFISIKYRLLHTQGFKVSSPLLVSHLNTTDEDRLTHKARANTATAASGGEFIALLRKEKEGADLIRINTAFNNCLK